MNVSKNIRGITLIALVITVIVLLILAGITIAMLTGENGILNQVNHSKLENEQKTIEEKAKLIVTYARSMDESATLTKNNLIKAINDEHSNGIEVSYEEDSSSDTEVICIIDENEIAINIPIGNIENRGKSLTATAWNINQSGAIELKNKNVIKDNKKMYVPSKVNGIVVTEISDNCFKDTDIEYVSIPSTVTNIGANAFSGCAKLTEIVMPCSLELSDNSFDGCINVSKVTLNASTNSTEIAKNANMPWYKTNVGLEIYISEGIEKVKQAAFADGGVDGINHITKVTIPSSVIELEEWAFSGCTNLTNIKIDEGLKIILGAAFMDCTSLKEIVLPSSVSNIYGNVFGNCKLENIYFRGSSSQVSLAADWKGNCNANVTYNYNS